MFLCFSAPFEAPDPGAVGLVVVVERGPGGAVQGEDRAGLPRPLPRRDQAHAALPGHRR